MTSNGPFKSQKSRKIRGDKKKKLILGHALENLIWHGSLNDDLIDIRPFKSSSSSSSSSSSYLNLDDSIDLKTHQHFMNIEEVYLNHNKRSDFARDIFEIGKKLIFGITKNVGFILVVIFVLILMVVMRGITVRKFFDYGDMVYKLLRFTIISVLFWILSIIISSLGKFRPTIIATTSSSSTSSVIANAPSTFIGYLRNKWYLMVKTKIYSMLSAICSFPFLRMFVNLDPLPIILMVTVCGLVYHVVEYVILNWNKNHDLITKIASLAAHIVTSSNREYITEITLREIILHKIINNKSNNNNNDNGNNNDLIIIRSHMNIKDSENTIVKENKVIGRLKNFWTRVVKKITADDRIQSQATILGGTEVKLFMKK